ncbi:MAG: ABC-F type ribosomal protection protein [Lachnospiraceae bacterium]|nr:ABC-F type ribosomal protection protein [Lachnospiraceae bacterium]
MILSCQNISKEFVTGVVLSDVSFHIEKNDRIGLIGINGSGKTTLLRIITGVLSPDSGSVTFEKGLRIGYLEQTTEISGDESILDYLISVRSDLAEMEAGLRNFESQMSHESGDELTSLMNAYDQLSEKFDREGGYTYKSEAVGILKGLGFDEEDFSRSLSTLSGGQKTRVSLGRLLLQKPDLIILDEPTNHLDMKSISWLEGYLSSFQGAVLIVSHDRYFLDRIVNGIVEIENGKSLVFTGNYSDFAYKKAELRKAQLSAYLNQQREIEHQEAVIEKLKSFNREKSIKRAESREKMLDKIERLDKPQDIDASMTLKLTPRIMSGDDVLTVKEMSKSYDDLLLFSDVSLGIKRGEHVAIIGDNGTGKTTLLKILNGLETPDSGSFDLGTNVEVGYYDQEHHVLSPEKNLIEEISDAYPSLTTTQIRNTLAAFLFTGDDVFKRIKDLSGGERGRVSLAKLMLSDCNFLILDEPTNHLDIYSKEILEDAIRSYEGTVLYVSHDRYFINRTASRILELSDHTFTGYLGDYDYYLEKKAEKAESAISAVSSSAGDDKGISSGAADWKAAKEEESRRRKQANELKKCEEKISSLEERMSEIDASLSDPKNGNDIVFLQKLTKEKESIESELEVLMGQWTELSS